MTIIPLTHVAVHLFLIKDFFTQNLQNESQLFFLQKSQEFLSEKIIFLVWPLGWSEIKSMTKIFQIVIKINRDSLFSNKLKSGYPLVKWVLITGLFEMRHYLLVYLAIESHGLKLIIINSADVTSLLVCKIASSLGLVDSS